MRFNLKFDDAEMSTYNQRRQSPRKKSEILVPLKWFLPEKTDSQFPENAMIVIIGQFLNAGHLQGGGYYGGDYYQPYSMTVPFERRKADFPIQADGQTTISALVLSKAESKKFRLKKAIRKPGGVKTNTDLIIIRPFPVAGLKETVEMECRYSTHAINYPADVEYYKKLRSVWKS